MGTWRKKIPIPKDNLKQNTAKLGVVSNLRFYQDNVPKHKSVVDIKLPPSNGTTATVAKLKCHRESMVIGSKQHQ